MTDAHTVVPCGLAYVFAGGCALEPPPLTVPPPPHRSESAWLLDSLHYGVYNLGGFIRPFNFRGCF